MLSKEEKKRLEHYERQVAKRKAEWGKRPVKSRSAVRSGIVYRETPNYPSVISSKGVAERRENTKYTGDKLVGIGMMHKSNLVPIFSEEEAKDVSTMRRN